MLRSCGVWTANGNSHKLRKTYKLKLSLYTPLNNFIINPKFHTVKLTCVHSICFLGFFFFLVQSHVTWPQILQIGAFLAPVLQKYQPVSQQVSAIIRNAKSPVLFLAVRFTLQLDIVHCSKQQWMLFYIKPTRGSPLLNPAGFSNCET